MTIFGSKKKSEKKPRGYKKRSRQKNNIRFISHVYKYSIQIKVRTDFQ